MFSIVFCPYYIREREKVTDLYFRERCVGMTTVASPCQANTTNKRQEEQPTHTMRKRISSIQIHTLMVCVSAGVVSVRALAIFYAVPIHPCDCQMILRGYFIHRKKKSIYFGGGSIFIHIDARRYSSRGKKFAHDLFRGRFNFCRMKYIFLLFLLFFLSRTRPLSLVQPKRPKVCIVLYGWCV